MKTSLFKCTCFLIIALLSGAAGLNAQSGKDVSKAEKAPEVNPTPVSAPRPVLRCEICKHAVPTEVNTSTKDAVVFYGPPDGKGAPVEYQVFVQMTPNGAWTFAARGDISKPGEKHAHCFANTAQVMVFVWCDTPFGNIAEFSDGCK